MTGLVHDASEGPRIRPNPALLIFDEEDSPDIPWGTNLITRPTLLPLGAARCFGGIVQNVRSTLMLMKSRSAKG